MSCSQSDVSCERQQARTTGTPVKSRTQVSVYGPPGTSYRSYSDGGGALAIFLVGSANDLGRPVAHIAMDLLAG
jgi:hypothetical protein